ncbi:MAG: bifunctional diguanylate cyclase/phosphodiesterase [Burkholderiales bacterium]
MLFSSLRARLLALIVIAVLPWVGATAYHAWQDRQRAINEAINDEMQLVHDAIVQQDNTVADAKSLLQILSALPEIRAGTPQACKNRLVAVHEQLPGYTNLLVTDAHGTLLCASKGDGQHNFGDRAWFKQALQTGHFVVTSYLIGRIYGRPILPAAIPIVDARGKVQRVILAAIDVKWIGQLLGMEHLPKGTSISVLDSHGAVIARQPPRPKEIGKIHPLWRKDAVISGQASGTGEVRDTNGEHYLFAYGALSGDAGGANRNVVYVVVSVPKEQVLAQAQRGFAFNMIFLGVLTVLVLALAWYGVSAFVLRRIHALVGAARRIAEGDFSARVTFGVQGNNELHELAHAFDGMAESIERYFRQNARIMEVTPEALVISDEQGRIVKANAHTEQLFGYSREELIGQPMQSLIPERLRNAYADYRDGQFAASAVREMGVDAGFFAQRKDGTEFPADISLGALKTEKGHWVISAVRDMSERKKFEAQILHQATHDALTGLPNRRLFQELLSRAMARALRTERIVAVMFLDLDGFKKINDTLGHEEGDKLLKAVAERLLGLLRQDDVVARQGGDEFTILLQDVRIVQDMIQVAEKLLACIAEPLHVGTREMHITASIGITVFPFDDNDVDSLLRNADTAMYRAKDLGKNNFQFYTAEMNAAMCERMEIESGLRRALQEEQFVLHYQPQCQIASGKIVGMEALIRWQHPQQGMIPPAKFIPVAEESGLIVPLGEWVLRTACRQIKRWREAGMPHLKMAVNLSARQFNQADLLRMIQGVLEETGIDPRSGALELELTESMVMHNVEASVDMLKHLHEMGLQLSIDDFGTGYSSLSYLRRFAINTLKIDQSFVRDITVDPEDAALASIIVTLGHSLKLNVIAEGVETTEQLSLLQNMGCDEAQGYYLSKPLPAEALEPLLRAGYLATTPVSV